MVPCRWMTPVRARIASRSVVLPLWNGPTSATQRGPMARVLVFEFVAIAASRRCPAFLPGDCRGGDKPSFQATMGLVKGRDIARTLLLRGAMPRRAAAAGR